MVFNYYAEDISRLLIKLIEQLVFFSHCISKQNGNSKNHQTEKNILKQIIMLGISHEKSIAGYQHPYFMGKIYNSQLRYF